MHWNMNQNTCHITVWIFHNSCQITLLIVLLIMDNFMHWITHQYQTQFKTIFFNHDRKSFLIMKWNYRWSSQKVIPSMVDTCLPVRPDLPMAIKVSHCIKKHSASGEYIFATIWLTLEMKTDPESGSQNKDFNIIYYQGHVRKLSKKVNFPKKYHF